MVGIQDAQSTRWFVITGPLSLFSQSPLALLMARPANMLQPYVLVPPNQALT